MEQAGQSADKALRNIIRKSGNADERSYINLPDGRHQMGLTIIEMGLKKKFQSEEMEDCYKLVFRSRKTPDGFITHKITPSWGPKSNLYKLLVNMTDGLVKEDWDADEVFAVLKEQLGRWFEVHVQSKPFKDSVWVSMRDNLALPIAGSSKWPNAVDYFADLDGKEKEKESSGTTGFEDAEPVKLGGSPKPAKQQALVTKSKQAQTTAQELSAFDDDSDELPF
jgi:hypothetical protein